MSTGSIILQAYLHTSKEMAGTLRYEDIIERLLKETKWGVLTPLTYYLDSLKQTDEVLFAYMDNERAEKVLRDLQITQLLLSTQKEHEQRRQKTENAAAYEQYWQRCAYLINLLQAKKYRAQHNFPLPPDFGQQTDGRPVAYLGISIGQWLAQQVASWMNSKTKTVIGSMNAFNEKRLYWVWGSVLLKTMIDLMPADLANLDTANDTAHALDPLTGTLSWSLYYCRFFFHLGLFLKHTIKGPWMGEEERKMPWQERFQTQWDQRKFALLNDFLWATVNLLYFFWLNGKGALGAAGDLLTVIVLVFDLAAAVWDFDEQRTHYNKEMFDYEQQLTQLKAEQSALDPGDTEYIQKMKEYAARIEALERARARCKRDWDYQKPHLVNSISYAVGLLIAYVLLAAPFLPIGGAALVAVGLAGAIMCFAFTVINNGVRGGIELYKEHNNTQEAIADYKNKLHQLGELFTKDGDPNSNDKKLLYLEVLQAAATTDYQHQLVELKTAHLIRSVFIQSVIPALILVNLVFLPLGIGLGVIGGLVALAIFSNFVVDKLFKAEKKSLAAFHEAEYISFCNKQFKLDLPCPKISEDLSRGSKSQSFFSSGTTEYSYSGSYDSGYEADDEADEFIPRLNPSKG